MKITDPKLLRERPEFPVPLLLSSWPRVKAKTAETPQPSKPCVREITWSCQCNFHSENETGEHGHGGLSKLGVTPLLYFTLEPSSACAARNSTLSFSEALHVPELRCINHQMLPNARPYPPARNGDLCGRASPFPQAPSPLSRFRFCRASSLYSFW